MPAVQPWIVKQFFDCQYRLVPPGGAELLAQGLTKANVYQPRGEREVYPGAFLPSGDDTIFVQMASVPAPLHVGAYSWLQSKLQQGKAIVGIAGVPPGLQSPKDPAVSGLLVALEPHECHLADKLTREHPANYVLFEPQGGWKRLRTCCGPGSAVFPFIIAGVIITGGLWMWRRRR